MTCRLVLQPEAEADLHEAYRWYEAQCRGLGRELIECVEAAFERIRQTPEVHVAVYRNVRQTLVRRFPYVVCYVFEGGVVDVVAVFHGHRDPSVWKSRVGGSETSPDNDN
jgi:plasmid stabilization system protein ParE